MDPGAVIHYAEDTNDLDQRVPNYLFAPPVPHLLSNNDPPSEQEVQLIRDAISIANADMANHCDQVDQASSYLATYSQPLLGALQQFVQTHKSLLSIRRHIPPEIWSLIFERCLSDGDIPNNCEDIAQVTRLSSVCRHWRKVALSNPRLWVRIPLHPLMRRKVRTPSYLGYVRDTLLRGREMPISFEVIAPFEEYQSHPLLDLMVAHCHRWRYAIFSTTAVTLQALKVSGRMPLLHTLNLDVNNLRNSPDVLGVFQDLPSLRIVKVKGLWPVKIELPWGQIEEYSENSASPVGIPQIMEFAKNLRRLSYSTYQSTLKHDDLPHAKLTNLTSLRLHCSESGQDFGPLLDNLTLPAVRELQVSNRAGELVRQIINLVRRSKCSLRRLAFFTSPLKPGELTKLLLLTPELEELDTHDLPAQDLEQLAQPSIVPYLRTLVVHFNSLSRQGEAPTLDAAGVNAMARYRCSAERTSPAEGDCARLEEFRFVFQVPEECFVSQAALERWDEIPDLHGHREILSECIEGLRSLMPDSLSSSRYFGSRHPRVDSSQLNKLLSSVENLQDVDTRILMKSTIAYHLQKFGQRYRDWVSRENHELVSAKISAIFDKWLACAKMNRLELHWIRRGEGSLIYCAEPAKASFEAKDFLYGIPESLMEHDLFWPTSQLPFQ